MSDQARAPAAAGRPAYYAARHGPLGDWWTLLHPPYTAWHLSYVVIGAVLAPRPALVPLLATLGAFFLAIGLAAHALDELHGRPLRTQIPAGLLTAVTAVSLAGALALGVYGVLHIGWVLVPFMVIGPLLVVGYNAELLGGLIHTDAGYAVAGGAFPLLTAYVAEAQSLSLPALLAGGAAVALSAAQRSLSSRAKLVRRKATAVSGQVTLADGTAERIDSGWLLAPLERTLRALSWSVVLFAVALALARLRLAARLRPARAGSWRG